MSVVDSQKLHGRMQFPDAQMFGRLGRLCMRAVTSMLSPSLERSWRVKPLMPAKVSIFLENAEPRSLTLSSDSVWNIFTDACYEPQRDSWKCGFGECWWTPLGGDCPFSQLSQWSCRIYESKRPLSLKLSFLALVLTFSVWRRAITFSSLVCFVDNNFARDVAILDAAGTQ